MAAMAVRERNSVHGSPVMNRDASNCPASALISSMVPQPGVSPAFVDLSVEFGELCVDGSTRGGTSSPRRHSNYGNHEMAVSGRALVGSQVPVAANGSAVPSRQVIAVARPLSAFASAWTTSPEMVLAAAPQQPQQCPLQARRSYLPAPWQAPVLTPQQHLLSKQHLQQMLHEQQAMMNKPWRTQVPQQMQQHLQRQQSVLAQQQQQLHQLLQHPLMQHSHCVAAAVASAPETDSGAPSPPMGRSHQAPREPQAPRHLLPPSPADIASRQNVSSLLQAEMDIVVRSGAAVVEKAESRGRHPLQPVQDDTAALDSPPAVGRQRAAEDLRLCGSVHPAASGRMHSEDQTRATHGSFAPSAAISARSRRSAVVAPESKRGQDKRVASSSRSVNVVAEAATSTGTAAASAQDSVGAVASDAPPEPAQAANACANEKTLAMRRSKSMPADKRAGDDSSRKASSGKSHLVRGRTVGVGSSSSMPKSTASTAAGAGAVAAKKRQKNTSRKLVLPFAYAEDDSRVFHVESCEGIPAPEYLAANLCMGG